MDGVGIVARGAAPPRESDLCEHLHEDDEIHVAYNAMQSGWRDDPPHAREDSTFTELFFEYSALIVIRRGRRRSERELTEAAWALVERLDRA